MPELKYPKPNYDAYGLVNSRQCFERAQRALEVAEMNLDELVKGNGGRLANADTLAHAAARARVGQGWAALALAMRSSQGGA